ncbi:hypothetical protein BKA81DRAFT_347284 [Phyllosticta paracitricarpa]
MNPAPNSHRRSGTATTTAPWTRPSINASPVATPICSTYQNTKQIRHFPATAALVLTHAVPIAEWLPGPTRPSLRPDLPYLHLVCPDLLYMYT